MIVFSIGCCVMMNSRLRWKPENEGNWICLAFSRFSTKNFERSFTSNPRSVDIVAAIDSGLRRQVNASCFDRDDILVTILVQIARFDRGHEVELFRFP